MYASGEEFDKAGHLVPAYRPAKHIWYLGERLKKIENDELDVLLVSMPPRHSKSETISKWFSSWFLGRNPDKRIILSSFGKDLTVQWATATRDALSEHGEEIFGAYAVGRAKATDWRMFRNGRRCRGGFFSSGRGGAVNGRGADVAIVDDLVKDESEARSPTVREHTLSWVRQTFLARLQPGGKFIGVGTRWHHQDVLAELERIFTSDPDLRVEVINFPAIATENDILGREPGGALWPEQWPLKELEKKRRVVGPYGWQTCWQGRPTPEQGALFQREWFRYYEDAADYIKYGNTRRLKRDLVYFSTNDLAVSDKTYADFSAFATWACDLNNAELFLVDVVRKRLKGPAILKTWERQVEQYDLPAIYVEKNAFGLQLCQVARDHGLPIRWLKADKNKVARAQTALAAMEGGKIFFPAGAQWIPSVESELLMFPETAHDDVADVIAYGARVFFSLLKNHRMRQRAQTQPTKITLNL